MTERVETQVVCRHDALTLDQVRQRIEIACQIHGGADAWARANHFRSDDVRYVVTGHQLPGKLMLAALGLRAQTTTIYHEVR